MGYAYYTLPDGREAGYAVTDVCNAPDCQQRIDRGLDYLCGDNVGDGGEHGCGRYFCGLHTRYTEAGQLCRPCADRYLAAHPEDDDD